MFNKWKPNAPALGKAFNEGRRGPLRLPVSKNEIEHLERQRRKLVLQHHPAPKGAITSTVNREVSRRLEVQIAERNQRLNRETGNARTAFTRSR